ncbi:MAG: CDP-diacylglycerol--glycerol-3-phosphate 3-phosphatidyltransferase [Eubacteriales bacterium]|nr:CDP-diacylglycerol--glycerol-3-phosphate 3-phosphatidyltransferase [Eubacteriales bacterium]MDY4898481.1 CDP-diacylglycerol--glycerol-3-phosphate 3-phosphatidyltransferase [Eubacteriales bacterium]
MNLPNKLTVIRMCMVPVVIALIMLAGIIPPALAYLLAAAVFSLASLTDMLDGRIARKYNLITDFGRFLDPLADKFMVIGTMLCLLYKMDAIRPYFFWAVLLVVFRELMVTGLRLVVVSSSGKVIAANKLGKIKTVTQMVCVVCVLVEPAVEILVGEGYPLEGMYPVSIVTTVVMAFFTLLSGAAYVWGCRHLLNPNK